MRLHANFWGLIGLLLVPQCYGVDESPSDLLPLLTPPLDKIVPYTKPGTQRTKLKSTLSKQEIVTVAELVGNWQLSQYDIRSNQMRREERASALPKGWIYATFNIGLLSWGLARSDIKYIEAVKNISMINDWKLGPRKYHADDHAIGQVYLDLFELYKEKRMINDVKQSFDWILNNQSKRELNFDSPEIEIMQLEKRKFEDPWCTQRWCWADAIFMAPPVWAELTKITGDDVYLEFMDKEFWKTTKYLYNESDHLYLRDSRYFNKRDSAGNLIYWGRGNGWVLAGIARIIANSPKNWDQKEKYVNLFKEMSSRIISTQNNNGSWPSSLLEPDKKETPESSATGLIVYALTWGVNNGVLERDKYLPAIEKGWQSLVESVDRYGKLGWVQQVAFAPGSATKKDTELYGTGALLLAASEIYKLVE